jgi:sugar phosphate isomerase/epimerase
MKLGIFTDGLLHLPFEPALDKIAALGIQAVEIGTGNFSPAPHCDMANLLRDDKALANFQDAITSRGLIISALNCSGNPLHPRSERGSHDADVIRNTILLAERQPVPTILTGSRRSGPKISSNC